MTISYYLIPQGEKNSDTEEMRLPISKSGGKMATSQKLRCVFNFSSYYTGITDTSFKTI